MNSKQNFKIGDRVTWADSVLNLATRKRRDYTDTGTIYRIDRTRAAVMPASWAKEGKRDGLLKPFDELALDEHAIK